MRKFLPLIALFLTTTFTHAVNEDSSYFRKYKVTNVKVMLRLPMLINKTDTCLFREREINDKGLTTKMIMDNGCLGYESRVETSYTYDERDNIVGIQVMENDKIQALVSYEFDSLNREVKEVYRWFEPYPDSSTNITTYSSMDKEFDSLVTMTFVQGDTLINKRKYFWNNGKKIKIAEFNGVTGKQVSQTIFKYDLQNRLSRYEYSNFEEYDVDQVTTYTYNDKGRVYRTEDVLNEMKAEFYYYHSGLKGKSFYYNKFGDLEREELYEYEFAK